MLRGFPRADLTGTRLQVLLEETLRYVLLQASPAETNAPLPVLGALAARDGLELVGRDPTSSKQHAATDASPSEAVQVELGGVTRTVNMEVVAVLVRLHQRSVRLHATRGARRCPAGAGAPSRGTGGVARGAVAGLAFLARRALSVFTVLPDAPLICEGRFQTVLAAPTGLHLFFLRTLASVHYLPD